MALIRTQGKLTYKHPATDGIMTAQPFQRDWRPDETWGMSGTEYIEPLKAAAPFGDLRPRSMETTWGFVPDVNDAVRSVYLPGNPPVVSAEFYDASVYAAGTSAAVCAGGVYSLSNMYPNFTLRLARYAPPEGQGITPQTSVTMNAQVRVSAASTGYYLDKNGTWTNGVVFFDLPFQRDTAKQPVLAWSPSRSGGTMIAFAQGSGSGQSLDNGMASECWVFEWLEDATAFDGGHFLIRNSSSPSDWWHTYQENIRLVAGPITITMAGCRQVVNCSPIYYSDEGVYGTPTNEPYCYASKFQTLPGADTEASAQWAERHSEAPTGSTWTVATDAHDDAIVQAAMGYRPRVTFTPATVLAPTRPVLWFATQDHSPTFTVPTGLPADEDTEGDGNLADMTLHFTSEWRGATGHASFYPRDEAQYESWLERGLVVCSFGWQTDPDPGTGMAATDTATMWLKPGGIRRGRDGATEMGRPTLEMDLIDATEAKLATTCVVDMGQAGAMTADSWFGGCMNRLGIPAARYDVKSSIASKVIPWSKPFPSTAHLAPQDGDSWESHFDEVCKAAGLRWGYNPFTAKWFLDDGKPTYSHGVSTIALTVDNDTLTAGEMIFSIGHESSGVNIRNRYKVLHGDEGDRRAYYYQATDAEIQAAGQDLWAVANQSDGDTIADLLVDLNKQHRTDFAQVTFVCDLRRALQPDQFVKIADCPEIGLTANTVWQITEIEHRVAAGETEVTAVLVYTPTA